MTARYFLQVAAVLLSIGPALADDIALPDYDVDKMCASPRPLYSAGCVRDEQAAYDALKHDWSMLDDAGRRQIRGLPIHTYAFARDTADQLLTKKKYLEGRVPKFERWAHPRC